MSKQGKRKITVEIPKSKDLTSRPSVFERLGTKKSSSSKKIDSCRQWAQHGSCAYGKCCKFASTHVLISPSKQRAAIKDPDQKKIKEDIKRLHSSVVIRGSGPSPDGELENWDQNDLEYADTDVLEKRRQQLQRELELQLKMDSGKDMAKEKKKTVVSSSSSRSSSSSSVTSSSSDGSSSSSSSDRDSRRKIKKTKSRRDTSSSSEGDVPRKKIKTNPKKSDLKKAVMKKDPKKIEVKKKVLTKTTLGKKSISPVKKSGGTPPITSKALLKKAMRSPPRKDTKGSSPHTSKDRVKEKEREKEKERNTRGRSRTPKKAKSKSPRRHSSHSKDLKGKGSTDRGRAVSPKKQTRKDDSTDRYRKRSASRERGRDKDRSLDRRKDKIDDRYNKDRQRDRKDLKRDDKRRGRDRGLGRPGDKGLEKPSKPMERLLPRPEERLAALAAITNKSTESDKGVSSKDRNDPTGRNRKSERDRDRSGKRVGSIDRDQGEYMGGRNYTRSRSMERYDRGDSRYNGPRDGDRSPDYVPSRDRHYDQNYDARYPEEDDQLYGNRADDHRRSADVGYEDRRHRGRSWEGRGGSIERGRYHGPKDWSNEEYRPSGEWNRDRHWPMRDNQMNDWNDKEKDSDWHHHGNPSGSHPSHHDDYRNRSDQGKRRPRESEPGTEAAPADAAKQDADVDDKPIPDDLSEISDDPDDILNRDDMLDPSGEEDTEVAQASDISHNKSSANENQSVQDNNVEKEQDVKDDDENTNLDFEEISDGELEEDRNRAGLGDALGVDWASLVADVHRKEQSNTPTGGARDRWRPERVLSRIGLSIQMAGTHLVQRILDQNVQSNEAENGEVRPTVDTLHPVAEIQVATEKRKRQRAILFGSGGEITRALSARRDLSLRRHLCLLPPSERAPHTRSTPQPELFCAARALFARPYVVG